MIYSVMFAMFIFSRRKVESGIWTSIDVLVTSIPGFEQLTSNSEDQEPIDGQKKKDQSERGVVR